MASINISDDVLTRIFAIIASLSIPDLHKIRRVSKRFHHLSYDDRVLIRASLDSSMFLWDKDFYFSIIYPEYWPLFQHQYESFILECLECRNPHALTALFQLGLKQFFKCNDEDIQPQMERGFANIAHAAEEGLETAIKIYGFILITLGDEHRVKGYKLLAPYTIANLSRTEVQRFEAQFAEFCFRSAYTPSHDVMIHIHNIYVRDSCLCDGLTSRWLSRYSPTWRSVEELEGMPTSKACEACLWHEVIYRLFNLYTWDL